MRILFIGCVESSYRLLKKLIEINAEVVGVVTKDHSSFNSDFVDLRPLCVASSIPYQVVDNVNDENSIRFIESVAPDIGFCFGWSQLLKEDVIKLFPKGVVGFHPAALPKNRGRHPIIWALALGLSETASTFFMINSGVDEGDIVSQSFIPISYDDDASSLYNKIMDTAVKQEVEIVKSFCNGVPKIIQQDLKLGNIWRKRKKSDGLIDWRMSSRSIYNLVRALSKPYVGAHFLYNGNEYKVWKVQEISKDGLENIEPGKVLAINEDGSIDIKTGEGIIRLIEFDIIETSLGGYIL